MPGKSPKKVVDLDEARDELLLSMGNWIEHHAGDGERSIRFKRIFRQYKVLLRGKHDN
jgi:hypothetical protein